jgi:hypothetical protein
MPTVTLTFSAYAQKERLDGYHSGFGMWIGWIDGGLYNPLATGNPENLYASDNLYCSALYTDYSPPIDSQPLFFTGATGFIIVKGQSGASSIPNDATITGITVYVERKVVSGFNDGGPLVVTDDAIYLTKDGANETGTNWFVANAPQVWAYDTDEVKSFGGTTHLWGTTWTPTEIKSANFGVAYSPSMAKASQGGDVYDAKIDQIYVTVTYTGGTTSDNITPYGIKSNEFVSSLHKIVRNIKRYSVTSLEKL